MTDRVKPSATAVIIGLVGLIALAFGIAALAGVVQTLVLGGVAVLALILLVGVLVRRHIERKYPPVLFHRTDVSEVDAKIEEVRVRLAGGDSAAFGIHPASSEFGDAEGQIWLAAATDGVLDRIAVELALPDDLQDFSHHPAVAGLVAAGWEIESAIPQEWVILTRSDLTVATGLVLPVVEALVALFEIPPETVWTWRAIA